MSRSRLLALLGVLTALAVGVASWAGNRGNGSTVGAGDLRSTPTAVTGPEPTPDPAAEAAVRDLLARNLEPSGVFEQVSDLARELATLPWADGSTSLPEAIAGLNYDSYRAIEFRSEAALWRDRAPFELQLFHPGFLYTSPVHLHLVEPDTVRAIPFDPEHFDYGSGASDAERAALSVPADVGYAGFRIHYPLNEPASKDEIVVFLGASYFRMLGPGHVHGLSSRGLALNVAGGTSEEFPYYRAFWFESPTDEASTLRFYGLLDSPSLTAAYRFELIPGENTEMTVTARLYARTDVTDLGVAPLTSLFLHGPNRFGEFDDYRPQVHDSDGLLMRTADDEWIWRPLSNDSVLRVTSLRDTSPRGFGLVQRERGFDHYLDLEARYDLRPSEWVEIEGGWGAGGVELVELPTPSEFNDNIVAYWAPDLPLKAGSSREYRYRLTTFDRRLPSQSLGQVARTRIGHDALPGQGDPPPIGVRRFVVDFHDGELGSLTPADSVRAILVTSSGEVSRPVVQPLPDEPGWRATFRLVPEGNEPADMRLFLEVPGHRVTETWSYVWYPERIR